MKYVLKEHCHPIFEVIQIISRYVNKHSYIELCESLFKKQPDIEINHEMFQQLQVFMESVVLESQLDHERLDFFFKEDMQENELALVDYLFLIYNDLSIEDIDDLSWHVFHCYDEKGSDGLCQQLAHCLDSEGNYNDIEKMKQTQFIEYLNNCDFTIEEKYKILQILLDFSKLRRELDEILKKVFVIYQQKKSTLDPYLNEFLDYWKARLSEDTFKGYLKTTFNLQLDEIKDIITVYPTVMGINMGIFNDPREKNSDIIMFWGISFIKDFNINTIKVNKNKMLDELKVLSDPSKFDILMFISDKAAYGQEIAKELNLTTATISHHMQALVNARIVNLEKQQNRVYYSMNRRNVEALLSEVKLLLLKND